VCGERQRQRLRLLELRAVVHASILHPPTDIRSHAEIIDDQGFTCG
jgi:hypothetical protein